MFCSNGHQSGSGGSAGDADDTVIFLGAEDRWVRRLGHCHRDILCVLTSHKGTAGRVTLVFRPATVRVRERGLFCNIKINVGLNKEDSAITRKLIINNYSTLSHCHTDNRFSCAGKKILPVVLPHHIHIYTPLNIWEATISNYASRWTGLVSWLLDTTILIGPIRQCTLYYTYQGSSVGSQL